MIAQQYPNLWSRPMEDPRFEGLVRIANAIQDAFDVASGDPETTRALELEPGEYSYVTPLRLANLMREAADRIEAATEGSLPN